MRPSHVILTLDPNYYISTNWKDERQTCLLCRLDFSNLKAEEAKYHMDKFCFVDGLDGEAIDLPHNFTLIV